MLHIRSVEKKFGSLPVLKQVNLEARAGEFLVLLGPSGCGKSTLLNIIAGLEAASAGDIVIGDPDGVVIVPRSEIRAVLAQLAAVRANEASMLKAVRAGLREPGFITAILASDRVRYVDAGPIRTRAMSAIASL